MDIAVLGSGNGGCAVAFDCAMHGHRVRLFDFEHFPDSIESVRATGGIKASGDLEGFQSLDYVGHEIDKAISGADIIYAAFSTRPFAEACKPYLKSGQTVIVCPGSCAGSVEFKNGSGLDLMSEDVHVAETSTLPYAVRLIEPAHIHVYLKLKGGLFLSSLPAGSTDETIGKIQDVYPMIRPAKNIFQTSLQNGNPVIHPTITMMNTGLIERTHGDFNFYEDGVTPAVGRLIRAVDEERIAIGRQLEVDVLPDPELGLQQGYMTEASYDRGYSEAPGFKGIRAQNSLDYRYLNEDVGYGLIFMEDLGEKAGVKTPVMSALIRLASILMNRNYTEEAKRTLQSLGLSGYSIDELNRMLSR